LYVICRKVAKIKKFLSFLLFFTQSVSDFEIKFVYLHHKYQQIENKGQFYPINNNIVMIKLDDYGRLF